MHDMFTLALLGHLVGDFVFQTKVMNLRKSEKTWRGWLICAWHVSIYTICLMVCWSTSNPIVAVMIFVPHFVIDHWSLASIWLKCIRGRTFEAAFNSQDQYREFDVAFTSIIYKEVDSAFHLICLWLVEKLFF